MHARLFCVAALLLLAAGAHAGRSLQEQPAQELKNANIKFNYTLFLAPDGDYVALTDTPTMEIMHGCGQDGQKCSCNKAFDPSTFAPTSIAMDGVGTSGTATGLEFACTFNVQYYNSATRTSKPGCACRLHISMPYTGSNEWNHDCKCLDGFISQVSEKAWEVVTTDTVRRVGNV